MKGPGTVYESIPVYELISVRRSTSVRVAALPPCVSGIHPPRGRVTLAAKVGWTCFVGPTVKVVEDFRGVTCRREGSRYHIVRRFCAFPQVTMHRDRFVAALL